MVEERGVSHKIKIFLIVFYITSNDLTTFGFSAYQVYLEKEGGHKNVEIQFQLMKVFIIIIKTRVK